jgi:hypothetical protein
MNAIAKEIENASARFAAAQVVFAEYANAAREMLLPIVQATGIVKGAELSLGQPKIDPPRFRNDAHGTLDNEPNAKIDLISGGKVVARYEVSAVNLHREDSVYLHAEGKRGIVYNTRGNFVPHGENPHQQSWQSPRKINIDELKQVHAQALVDGRLDFLTRSANTAPSSKNPLLRLIA